MCAVIWGAWVLSWLAKYACVKSDGISQENAEFDVEVEVDDGIPIPPTNDLVDTSDNPFMDCDSDNPFGDCDSDNPCGERDCDFLLDDSDAPLGECDSDCDSDCFDEGCDVLRVILRSIEWQNATSASKCVRLSSFCDVI